MKYLLEKKKSGVSLYYYLNEEQIHCNVLNIKLSRILTFSLTLYLLQVRKKKQQQFPTCLSWHDKIKKMTMNHQNTVRRNTGWCTVGVRRISLYILYMTVNLVLHAKGAAWLYHKCQCLTSRIMWSLSKSLFKEWKWSAAINLQVL